MGILRDALRQKSMGIIEEIPEKGIVKYAKPAGVIASLVPVTSPYVTPIGIGIYAMKCKDAIIFSPHPASRKTTNETVRIMRAALEGAGAPEDSSQCVEQPSIPLAERPDVDLRSDHRDRRTGDGEGGLQLRQAGLRRRRRQRDHGDRRDRRHRRGRAQYARSARPTTTAPAARPMATCWWTPPSTTRSWRSCRWKAATWSTTRRKQLLQARVWDDEGHRTADTIARPAAVVAETRRLSDSRGQDVPDRRRNRRSARQHLFSSEKLGTVLAIFRYYGFDQALEMVRQIYEVGGKGHSCGIYSFDDEHIHRLALTAPVSRIMVRQPQSKANAGAFNNGMPMTSSMGCGIWGGNITNENVSLKHYMNVTWVSRPIPEDKPSEQELFGEFYDSDIFEPATRTLMNTVAPTPVERAARRQTRASRRTS